MSTAPVVSVQAVHKSFGDLEVLKGVSLDVVPGETVCLIGRSGSGKTTLLRCINHLETIDAGQIRVNGKLVGFEEHKGRLRRLTDKRVSHDRRATAMVFQQFHLFPNRTALENVMEGPTRVLGVPHDVARDKALKLLDRVGLANRCNYYPMMLSGGQQQRVGIARALAMDPAVILLDEPTSALDPELVGEVIAVLEDLANAGTTMIVVTHEIGFARACAREVVYMEDGVIVERGRPDKVLNDPDMPATQQFLRHVRR